MKNIILGLSLFIGLLPNAFANQFEIPADLLNGIPDIKDSLNDLAQGNEGKGWVESATVSWDSSTIALRLKAKIRHKHKTNGVTIYSSSETIEGRIVARDCEVVEVDASSSGVLIDALLRNRKFLKQVLDGIIDIPELEVQLPDEIKGDCQPRVNWTQLPGLASDIGVYDSSKASVLAFTSAGNKDIYKWNGSNWSIVPGLAVAIDTGADGTVWVANQAGEIYRDSGNGFAKLPGLALDVGVGANGSAWVIGLDQRIYRWNGSNWDQVPGSARRISVDPYGNAVVVNAAGGIYRYDGSTFVQMPGLARDVGVGADGSIWVIGLDQEPGGFGIHRWTGSTWEKVAGGGMVIDVDSQGRPWIANDSGQIFRLESE